MGEIPALSNTISATARSPRRCATPHWRRTGSRVSGKTDAWPTNSVVPRLIGAKSTTHKARLLARLTEAREYGLAKKDKRRAAQLALDAFLEWARAEDIPPEQMQLLVGLGSALDDLNLGKHPSC